MHQDIRRRHEIKLLRQSKWCAEQELLSYDTDFFSFNPTFVVAKDSSSRRLCEDSPCNESFHDVHGIAFVLLDFALFGALLFLHVSKNRES